MITIFYYRSTNMDMRIKRPNISKLFTRLTVNIRN